MWTKSNALATVIEEFIFRQDIVQKKENKGLISYGFWLC